MLAKSIKPRRGYYPRTHRASQKKFVITPNFFLPTNKFLKLVLKGGILWKKEDSAQRICLLIRSGLVAWAFLTHTARQVAFSPLANGLLSGAYTKAEIFTEAGDYRNMMPQFTANGISKAQELLTLLSHLAAEKKSTPAQISLAWMLCKKPYIVPIPGSRKLSRLKENFGAGEIFLSPEEISDIDAKLDTMNFEVFGGSPTK